MGIINNIYNFINIARISSSFQKTLQNYKNLQKFDKLKKDFHIQSLMEIKPFSKKVKEIVCKLNNTYILSSMKFDKTTGKYSFKKLGLMKGFPELVDSLDYYPNMSFYESFYVQKLKAEELRKGTGKKLLHLALCESRRFNCKGRIHLDEVNSDNPPFYFYRSLVFNSQSNYQIECIDKLMNNKTPFPRPYRSWCLSMYLPKNKTGI